MIVGRSIGNNSRFSATYIYLFAFFFWFLGVVCLQLQSDFQDNELFGPTIEPIVKEKAISDGEDEVFSPRKAIKRLTNRSFGSLDELQQRAERVEKANAMIDSDEFYSAIIESQAQMTARLIVYYQGLSKSACG